MSFSVSGNTDDTERPQISVAGLRSFFHPVNEEENDGEKDASDPAYIAHHVPDRV